MGNALVECPKPILAAAPSQAVATDSVPAHMENSTLTIPYGNETSTIRIHAVRYCQGLGLDLGCGGEKIIPQALGIDQQPGAANIMMDFGNLRIFSDNAFDFCYSSHAIEDVYYKEPVLREWWRVLKPNGYLILSWPEWAVYTDDPSVEFNQDHHDHFEASDIKKLLARFHGEVVLEAKVSRSNLLVIRKLSSNPKGTLKKKEVTKTEKSALLVRYGAFGDMIIVTPVLKALKQAGYHVTVNCSDYGKPVLDQNPNVDELIVHIKDSIQNDGKELPAYWEHLKEGTDRFINLSGSIEGSLLLLEGTLPMGCDAHREHYSFGCPACEQAQQARDFNIGSINYYDHTAELAGFPELKGQNGELYFTHGELFRAKDLVRKWRRKNQFVIVWSMSGSSYHKAYPYWGTVAVEFCRRHPSALIYTVGDEVSKLMEVVDHPQIMPRSSKWNIRESMCMTQFADLVIGGETGVMHAAGCYDTPKVVMLSHSTAENLTKYWKNCTTLAPNRKEAPCHPCHQMHYAKESCPLKPFPTIIHLNYDEPPIIQPPPSDLSQHWPVCMTNGIALDRVMGAMEHWYEWWLNGKKPREEKCTSST